jgi:hypothetical protein
MVAPLLVFMLPGLALSQVLLSDRAPIERILHAPALSLGCLLIAVMWSDLLGVRISFEAMALAGVAAIAFAWLATRLGARRAGWVARWD